MKKLLVGLSAVLGSGLSLAQSSVTVFGVLDSALEITKADGAPSLTRIISGANVPSRIGFRGNEDLGGGLSAAFWLEAGFFVDSGAGQLTNSTNTPAGSTGAGGLTFNRRSTVSLLGPFGEVRLGRDVVPSSLNYVAFDPFGGNGIGNSSALMLSNGVFSTVTALRASNTVSYFLPSNLGGWYGQAMVALGENAANVAPGATGKHDGDYYGGRVGYRNAKLDVALAAGRTRYELPATSTAVAGNSDRVNLGASYDFGVMRLLGLLSTERRARGTGGEGSNVSFSVGTIIPRGVSDFKLQYAQVKQNVIAGSNDARQYSAGWVYNLSKRTAFYTTLSLLDNRGNSKLYVLNTTGGFTTPATTTPGGNITGVDFGIRHSF
ncbi:Outer membrane protein (porin) [Polaromonas sp. OV174]|uniref:porin n=1 Tax=Polaromonas sp. OV174 TaxID=1855300 RepID=UPI0008F2BB7E|nr:porin [Polaromonas sp. OV174]SFC81957.1 Outer membrane protein (porin) [Polaromonas sp. OV174]